jgi:hypothetical protein
MTAAVTTTFDFAAYLEATRLQVEAALDGSLGPERPESLREAMRYSLLAGGKRRWCGGAGHAHGGGTGDDSHHVADP